MIINSRIKLEEWLSQNDWFSDGFISEIKQLNNEINLKIGYQTKGSYEAGNEKELIEFEIKPKNIRNWDYNQTKFQPSLHSYIEGIELIENGIGLSFQTLYAFEMEFDSIEIQEPKTIKTFTKPWISEREIFVVAKLKEVPKPKYWIDKLKEKGFDVCFRYFGSGEIGYDKVPFPNYSGYFLQHKNLLEKGNYGLFFFSVKYDESKNEIQFSLNTQDNYTFDLYKEIQKIIAGWEIVKVNCGNVEFKESDWKNFILKNKFPRQIEELKKKNVW